MKLFYRTQGTEGYSHERGREYRTRSEAASWLRTQYEQSGQVVDHLTTDKTPKGEVWLTVVLQVGAK